MNNVKK